MKILSWNCNGAFRKKFESLDEFDFDICIIQECEDPAQCEHKQYKKWAENYFWLGDSKNKGLAVFAHQNIQLSLLDWSDQYRDHRVKYFLPCRVNDDFNLLGVWTHKNNSPNFGYIGQLWKYLQVNKEHFRSMIIAGDLNSNKIWDEWDRWWNHSDVVRELSVIGIESLYHLHSGEKQGEESIPTLYLQRKLEKPYHIDYIFASKEFSDYLLNFEVGQSDKWLELSDHMPIFCEF